MKRCQILNYKLIKIEPADWPRTQKAQKNRPINNFIHIFFGNFVPRLLLSVSAEFHCHGIWGTGTNRCPRAIFQGRHLGCVIFGDLSICDFASLRLVSVGSLLGNSLFWLHVSIFELGML